MMVLMSEACPGQSTSVNWTLSNPFPARWLGTVTEKEENLVEMREEREYGREGREVPLFPGHRKNGQQLPQD